MITEEDRARLELIRDHDGNDLSPNDKELLTRLAEHGWSGEGEGKAQSILRTIRSWCDDPPAGYEEAGVGGWLACSHVAEFIDSEPSAQPGYGTGEKERCETWTIWVCECAGRVWQEPESFDQIACNRCRQYVREIEVTRK